MSVLILTLTGSVLLVVDVVLGRVEGVIAGSATLLVCGGLWGVLPQFVMRHAAQSEARAVSEPPAGSDWCLSQPTAAAVGRSGSPGSCGGCASCGEDGVYRLAESDMCSSRSALLPFPSIPVR
jgi:hypothetical protein